jgi:hypothetical protein
MAQDEGRFGRSTVPRRCWVPPGMRARAPRQVVREYSYAFTAVAPREGWMYSLILPQANSEMMSLFLAHVAQEYAGYFIVMQVDRAGWHGSATLVVPENIRLLPQPAHSPEVQPTEHIWDEVREKRFHNRAFDDLDAVEAALVEELNALRADPERVRSLTYFPHFKSVA